MADAFPFLPPGGETGAEIRARDWSATSLGPPEGWPPALHSALSLMLACPTAMFLAWGPDLLCFYNDAYRPILGYRLPTALGAPFRTVWASIWDEIEPLVRATLEGRSQTLTDVMLDLSREGRPEQSWWSFTYSPVLDDAGAITGLFCVTAETTARVLGEAALRESEDHFRHTVELNPQVPWTCDPDGNITSYSNRWLDLTGQAPGEPLGSGWVKALHPDDVPWTMTVFAAALSSGEPVDVDYRLHMVATGEYRWMRARAQPRRDASGAILRWYGVVEDIHDRKRAEDRLREVNETLERRVEAALAQRKLWADVFETTDALVAALDPDFGVLALNRAFADGFEAAYGVRPAVGDRLLDLLAGVPEQRALVRSIWGRALSGEEFTVVEEFGGPRHARSCYEIRFTALRDAQGRRIGAFQYAVDATERLRSQEQLARAEEALRHAQKMEAVGQLTGGVAHDFNNLLTIIRSSVEFLRRPNLAEERRTRYLEAVSDTVDRAAKLTSQLLAFARRQALKPEVFELGERVRATAEMLNRGDGGAHPHRDGSAGGTLPRAGGHEPVRDGARQHGGERARRHGRRGHADAPARLRGSTALHPRARRRGRVLRRRVGRGRGGRHRTRPAGADLRTVLHHEGDRQGDWARPQPGHRLRQAVRRRRRRGERGGPRHDLLAVPAPSRPAPCRRGGRR